MLIGIDASALVKQGTGVGNYISAILLELVKNTNDEFILYSNQNIEFPSFDNVTCKVSVPYRKGPLWQNTQLRQQIIHDKVDVFWGGNGYLPIGLPNQIKTVLTIHDLVYCQAGATMPLISRWSRKVFQPIAVKKADKIIAVSHATASEMLLHYNRSPNVVIHPQVNEEYGITPDNEQQRVKDKYQLSQSYFLVLGTLEPRKNLPVLVAAWIKLSEQGVDLPLLAIAGGKGWLSGDLPELVTKGEKLGVLKKLGYVEQTDMKALYAAADVFILPSLYEGFGMPVLEAQLCGTPVLISDIPSLNEASGGVACRFTPSVDGVCNVLTKYINSELPLACRLQSTISNDATKAANIMLSLLKGNCI